MPNPIAIPDDTRSLHAIGDYIMSYQPLQNAFADALVNRIAMVLITSRMWTNPLAPFKRGMMEYGETVEEVFVNIAKPFSFDPDGSQNTVWKIEKPDVRAAFHTMNYQKYYKVSISTAQLRQAFLSYDGITDLIGYIVDALYTAMNYDEWLVTKYLMCKSFINGYVYPVTVSAIEGAGAEPNDSIVKFRQYTNDLTFLKTDFNMAGVFNSTPVEDQVIFIGNHAEAVLGVEVLANAFNLNQVDYISQRIAIDSFEFGQAENERLAELFDGDPDYQEITGADQTLLQNVVAFKCDKKWFMIFDNFQEMTQLYNGEGLYWQYWLHAWKTFSISPFANAILFNTQDNKITGVTVSPKTANVAQGTDIMMLATVAGTGAIKKTVTWSIEAATETLASGTAIDPSSGKLHVAADQAVSSQITVTATAVDGKTGTATITVTAAS